MSVGDRGALLAGGAVAAFAAVIGLFAESVAFDWGDVGVWVPDLAAGWVLVGGGLVVIALSDGGRVGMLMVAAGLVWFLGNFEGARSPSVDWLARHGKLVYLAVLVAAALAGQIGRAHV